MNRHRSPAVWMARGTLLVGLGILACGQGTGAGAESEGKVGRFIGITAPITDQEVRRVERAARQALDTSLRQGQRPILVFEIRPGTGSFEDCRKLAKFLRTELAGAAENTVAYVPESLSGHVVMVALACRDLVLHPDAQIGDIGRDERQAPDQVQRLHYSELAQQRDIPEALMLGMLDRELEVVEVQTDQGMRYALRQDVDKLRQQAVVGNVRTIKRPGEPLVISAAEARTSYGLAKSTARTRADLADQYGLPPQAILEDPTLGVQPNAVVIRLDAPILSSMGEFLKRQIDRALARGANLLIFEIDSPGGYATTSMDVANRIKNIEGARTIAFVPRQALSGAAFVAVACDEIYMQPDARIGDAGPLFVWGGQLVDVPDKDRAKVVSDLATQMRAIAEAKGRSPALLQAMVDRDLVVYEVRKEQTGAQAYMSEQDLQNSPGWKKVRTVTHADRYLEMTGREARDVGLAKVVQSFDDLMVQLGLDSPPPVSGKTWVDDLIFMLNSGTATFLLLLIGITCLYIELHAPGISLPGIIAGLCFLLFFWSHILGGTAGWLEVLLFLSGLALLAIEIFVTPGFGVMGVSGILLVLFSVVLATQTFIVPVTASEWRITIHSLGTVSGALVAFVVAAVLLSRYLPSLPLLSRIVLSPPQPHEIYDASGPEGFAASVAAGLDRWLGKQGVTSTTLRPAGKARFGDDILDVVAEGYYIPEGRRVEIVEVSGNRVVVKEV